MRIFLAIVLAASTLFATAQNGHTKRVRALGFNAEGTQLLSGGIDGSVILWDEMGRAINTFHPPADEYRETNRMFSRVMFYKSGNYFLAAGLIEAYWGKTDVSALNQLKTGMMGGDRAFALTSDEQYIIIGQGINDIRIMEGKGEKTGQLVRSIPITGVQDVYPVANKPAEFLTYSMVSGAALMNVDGTVLQKYPMLTAKSAMAVSPSGDAFVHGNVLYNRSGKQLAKLKNPERVWDIAFSPDGQTIACTSGNSVLLWDRKGKLQTTIAHDKTIWSVAFTPDGTRLVFGSDDGTIEMWTVSGRQVQVYK